MIKQAVRRLIRQWLRTLDDERIDTFQVMYYFLLILAGSYLAFGTDNQPPGLVVTNPTACQNATTDGDQVEGIMGHPFYELWLGLNIICPILTLIGRYLGQRTAHRAEGEGNPGVGAAWMRFAGDLGVWGAIMIYVACVINTVWWGQGIYGAFFVLMGVPGGFMFTLRSMRRIGEMQRIERAIS